MTIQFHGDVHEFSMNTAYFTVTPQEFGYVSTDERAARGWAETLPKMLKVELSKRGGGIIWWRIEPEINHCKIGCDVDKDPRTWTEAEKRRGEEFFCWVGYARLATSPELPEEIAALLGLNMDQYREEFRKLREQAVAALLTV
jgi:hypothetical protein